LGLRGPTSEGRKGRAENRTQKGELRKESWREGKKKEKEGDTQTFTWIDTTGY